MNEDRLRTIVSQKIATSLGFYSGELSNHRKEGLKFYLGKPLGNEEEGQSQVVSQDILECVEAIMPSLMRVFTQGDSIVRFDPQQPEDVEYSEQASDYCNFIFHQDNNGYEILHTLFKDALISKNGFVKFYWHEDKAQQKEEYKNLNEEEYQALLYDNEIEITDTKINDEGLETQNYDVKVKRGKTLGRIKIENVAPEHMLVDRNATNIENATFIAQRIFKTRSELISMGYDRDIVDALPESHDEFYNDETAQRQSYDDSGFSLDNDVNDPSMTHVTITECYIKIDTDDDGIAELRKVTVAGNGYDSNQILSNEEVNVIPFATVTGVPMPHRFFGLSMYDLIGDIQTIKSTLLRQILNNTYLMNNSRLVVEENMVNIDDLLVSRAGGVIRSRKAGAVQPLTVPNFINEGLSMIKKIDEIRQARSGVSEVQMGLNADTINKSHTTAVSSNIMQQAGTQRIEMYARNFAEGVKQMFQGILSLVCLHQDKERIIRLRGKFINISPREWVDRYSARIQVGLGTGSQDSRLDVLTRVLNVQEKILKNGGMNIVNNQNIYNALERYLENAGIKDTSKFFNNPETSPPPPPKPRQPTAIDLAQAELKMNQEKDKVELAMKKQKLQQDAQFKAKDLELKEEKIASDIIRNEDLDTREKDKLVAQIFKNN